MTDNQLLPLLEVLIFAIHITKYTEAFFITVLHAIYSGTSFLTMVQLTYLPYVSINSYMFNIWYIF